MKRNSILKKIFVGGFIEVDAEGAAYTGGHQCNMHELDNIIESSNFLFFFHSEKSLSIRCARYTEYLYDIGVPWSDIYNKLEMLYEEHEYFVLNNKNKNYD